MSLESWPNTDSSNIKASTSPIHSVILKPQHPHSVSVNSVWYKEGPRSYNNSWQFASVPIGARHNFQIQLIGERGPSYQGDIAIDDISLTGCQLSKCWMGFSGYYSWSSSPISIFQIYNMLPHCRFPIFLIHS